MMTQVMLFSKPMHFASPNGEGHCEQKNSGQKKTLIHVSDFCPSSCKTAGLHSLVRDHKSAQPAKTKFSIVFFENKTKQNKKETKQHTHT